MTGMMTTMMLMMTVIVLMLVLMPMPMSVPMLVDVVELVVLVLLLLLRVLVVELASVVVMVAVALVIVIAMMSMMLTIVAVAKVVAKLLHCYMPSTAVAGTSGKPQSIAKAYFPVWCSRLRNLRRQSVVVLCLQVGAWDLQKSDSGLAMRSRFGTAWSFMLCVGCMLVDCLACGFSMRLPLTPSTTSSVSIPKHWATATTAASYCFNHLHRCQYHHPAFTFCGHLRCLSVF